MVDIRQAGRNVAVYILLRRTVRAFPAACSGFLTAWLPPRVINSLLYVFTTLPPEEFNDLDCEA